MKVRIEFRSGEVRHGMYVDGHPQELPLALQPSGPYETTVHLVGVEYDGGSDVDRIMGQVAQKIAQILDTTAHDHAVAAADLIAGTHLREVAWREALVEAAAHLLHAIHQIDRTRPVEVRADDLRALLDAHDHAAPFVEIAGPDIEDPALRRLRDALGGS